MLLASDTFLMSCGRLQNFYNLKMQDYNFKNITDRYLMYKFQVRTFKISILKKRVIILQTVPMTMLIEVI